MIEPITSARLELALLDMELLRAVVDEDRTTIERRLNCRLPIDLPLASLPAARRLEQLRLDPSEAPWLLRASVERESRTMIGHVGFHTPPRPDYLASIAADAVELGYSVHAPFRRRGYAREAALALMRWAYEQHAQRSFFLSISPQNIASTAMAKSLGFTPCGSHIDDEDGLEIEFVRRFEAWPSEWTTLPNAIGHPEGA